MRKIVTKLLFLYGSCAIAFARVAVPEDDTSTNATVIDREEFAKVPFEDEAMESERKNGPFARSSSPQECESVAPERREECDVTPHQKYADIILSNSTFCRYMDCCFDYTATFPAEAGYPRCYRKAQPNPQVAALLHRARQCSAIAEESRESCGWYREITEGECIYRDCCWDPAAYGTARQCYKLPNQNAARKPIRDDAYPKPAYGISEASVLPQEHQGYDITAQCQDIDLYSPCGAADVPLRECQALGCCWVESDSYNVKCFRSSPIASGKQVSAGVAPTVQTVAVAPVSTKLYDRLPEPQYNRPVASQNREVQPKSGIQKTTPDLSALTQMMIFCGKEDKTLCTMSMMSILGGSKIKPSTKAPSAEDYMNYVLHRTSYGESSSAMQPKIPGEMYIQYSPTGDAYLDEQCYNTTQLKMYARFHAPCGGFLKSKKITTEQECISEKCCWFDDYHSILRKALKLDSQKPSMLHHVYPMLGIDITRGANCIEALSYRQISKIGQMSALNSYREDAEHSSLNSPQLLNLFLDQDDPVSTVMSSMMLLSDGSLSQMSRPMLYSMAQSEEDSRVILPMVFNKIQEDTPSTSFASPGVSSRSSLMGIMPALLMLGAKNNDDDDDDSDTKNDFLPLIMAAMSSNGNLGSNAGGIDPLYLAMMGSDGGMSDPLLQMAILSMRNRPLIPYGNGSQAQNQQAWGSSGPNYQSAGQPSAERPQQNQMSGLVTALMMSKFMGDDSDSGASMKDLLPILLSQSQGSGGQMSSDLAYMIPALLSGDQDNSNSAMMMQLLTNPGISRNPQLMSLLLSNSGESDESMMPMLMYAMSQPGQASEGGNTDMMSWMLPMLLNSKSSDNSSNSFDQFLPIIMQSMQNSNTDSQSLAIPLLLNNPSMLSDNPSLLATLFSSQTGPAQPPASSGLPVSAMMSLMSGKPLNPLALLSMTTGNTQRPNTFGQGQGLFASAGSGNRNIFGNSPQTSIPSGMSSNHFAQNPAVQSVLGSEGDSMDKFLIKLLMKSQLGGADSASTGFGQNQQSQFVNQPQNPFANIQFNPLTNPFQPSLNSLSGQGHQSPFPNVPVNIPSLLPNTHRPAINPNAFPNFGKVSNDVTTGILVAPHDNEHSYNQGEDDCMIPPGAEEECDLSDVQSPLLTEQLCKERNCCWNPTARFKCYKSASQS